MTVAAAQSAEQRETTGRVRALAQRLAVLLAVVYVILAVGLMFGQRRLIFFPTHDVSLAPDYFHVPYEDVFIEVHDGQGGKINAWWAPATNADAPAVIMFHGNAETISGLAKQTQRFHDLGLSALVVEYRGYGRSTGGFPSEASVYADAQAGWEFLLRRGLAPGRIFIFGHSLGGAVAMDLASKHPDAAGVILESTLTSVADIGKRLPLFRFFPLELLVTQRFDSLNKAKSLKVPALVVHGDADPVIPLAVGRDLFTAIASKKQFVLVHGGDHDHIGEIGGAAYMNALREFVGNPGL